MFKLEFETGNAAFGDDESTRCTEVARILRKIADRVDAHVNGGYPFGPAVDLNGNKCGHFVLTAEG